MVCGGKAWVGPVGALLTFIIPTLVSMSTSWPEPWPAVISAGGGGDPTAVGIYHAPYSAAPSFRTGAAQNPGPTLVGRG